jgi:hypothetical protein
MKRTTVFIVVFSVLVVAAEVFAISLTIPESPYLAGRSETEKGKTEEERIREVKEILQKEPERPLPSDVRRGGLLLKKGQFGLDLSTTYAHFSENQIFIEGFALLPVLVIGEITVEKIKQDILIGSVTAKYGLSDRVQLEATVPYRYHSESFFRPDVAIGKEEEKNDDHGIGDIYGSLLFHLLQERAVAPHILGSITFKSRTGKSIFDIDPGKGELPMGTGFYSLKAGLSFIKTADPAVVFFNLGYTHSFPRKDEIFLAQQDPTTKEITYTKATTKLTPGDAFEAGFGVAYALSYKLGLNTQYQHSITQKSKRDGHKIPGTLVNVGAIRFGGVWAWSDITSIDLSTTIGVTADAPDAVVELRLSYRF